MKWHKTNESLPLSGENVLAAVKWDKNLVIAYRNKNGWNISVDLYDYLTVSGGYIESDLENYEVTHWAEMPEMPKDHQATFKYI